MRQQQKFTNSMKKCFKTFFNFRNVKYFSSSNRSDNFFDSRSIGEIISTQSRLNTYQGIELNLEKLISPDEQRKLSIDESQVYIQEFSKAVEVSMTEWDKQNVRSLTIAIPSYLSHLIPVFVKNGFYFHHTSEDELIVCKWLDKNVKNKMPRFAHHHVGVGACIINKNLEFLLIKEKYIPSHVANRVRLWKFVTGLVEGGESVKEAVHREVKEEVNMDVDYHGCIIMSESYPNIQKISDLCFFNLCSVKGDVDFNNISIDKDELEVAKFFSWKEIQNLVSTNQTTILTSKTFAKLIPLLNFNKDLPQNLENLRNNRRLLIIDEIPLHNSRYKHLNIYH